MSQPFDPIAAPDALEAAIDRLVADDLDADARRALLLQLDAHPDGWRRCALAFLEDQAWRSALAPTQAATLPDPVWQCGACGTVHEAWHPVCSACGTPGRIAWTVPAGMKAPAPEPEHAVLPPAVAESVAGSVAGPVAGLAEREVPRLPHVEDAEPIR